MTLYAIYDEATDAVVELSGIVLAGVMVRMPALFLDRAEAASVLKTINRSGLQNNWKIKTIPAARRAKQLGFVVFKDEIDIGRAKEMFQKKDRQ